MERSAEMSLPDSQAENDGVAAHRRGKHTAQAEEGDGVHAFRGEAHQGQADGNALAGRLIMRPGCLRLGILREA